MAIKGSWFDFCRRELDNWPNFPPSRMPKHLTALVGAGVVMLVVAAILISHRGLPTKMNLRGEMMPKYKRYCYPNPNPAESGKCKRDGKFDVCANDAVNTTYLPFPIGGPYIKYDEYGSKTQKDTCMYDYESDVTPMETVVPAPTNNNTTAPAAAARVMTR